MISVCTKSLRAKLTPYKVPGVYITKGISTLQAFCDALWHPNSYQPEAVFARVAERKLWARIWARL